MLFDTIKENKYHIKSDSSAFNSFIREKSFNLNIEKECNAMRNEI